MVAHTPSKTYSEFARRMLKQAKVVGDTIEVSSRVEWGLFSKNELQTDETRRPSPVHMLWNRGTVLSDGSLPWTPILFQKPSLLISITEATTFTVINNGSS